MHILEIHIEVEDIEKSLDLYSQLIPHKRIERWEDGSAVALVLENGSAFGLWKKGKRGIHNGRGGEHVHFAFRIAPGDYDHYLEKVTSLGLEVLKYEWPDDERSIYFFDYDDHQVEFMTKDW